MAEFPIYNNDDLLDVIDKFRQALKEFGIQVKEQSKVDFRVLELVKSNDKPKIYYWTCGSNVFDTRKIDMFRDLGHYVYLEKLGDFTQILVSEQELSKNMIETLFDLDPVSYDYKFQKNWVTERYDIRVC